MLKSFLLKVLKIIYNGVYAFEVYKHDKFINLAPLKEDVS